MYVFIVLFIVVYVEDVIGDGFCRLGNDAWVQYCFEPGYSNGLRRCNTFEAEGVIVRPGCSAPNRHSNQSLAPRRCVGGKWEDILNDCKPVLVNSLPVAETDNVNVNPNSLSAVTTCVLPPNPEHGTYTVSDVPNAVPGPTFDFLQLNINCNIGYGVIGESSVVCYQGKWLKGIPKCERACKVNTHPSVQYYCLVSGAIDGLRICNTFEPAGTVIRAECNAPNYYSPVPLPVMECNNGNWSAVVTCQAECGKVTPEGQPLLIGGRQARRGELPWHAGIYKKTTDPYLQHCGGSLISTTTVISAAHCFWSQKQVSTADDHAVAVGKLYKSWHSEGDENAQKSDVLSIHLSKQFRGNANYYAGDIAVLVVATAFELKTFVRPICLNFEDEFEKRQLRAGNLGKMVGWGLTSEKGVVSPVLQVAEFPYIDNEDCYIALPDNYKEYLTDDKICAGYRNGTAPCRGDGGGGLAFSDSNQGNERYYLQGVVSTAPSDSHKLCDSQALALFTRILKHRDFLRLFL